MINIDPRKRRRLVPIVTGLESRRLLSFSVTSLGQDGLDLVGPDASQGPDGIQDLDLQLSGLLPSSSNTIDRMLITPQGGVSQGSFAWQTQPTPGSNVSGLGEYGYSMAEFFYSSSTTGHLYINPQVKSVAPPAGAGSLGGSTGPLVGLQNGDWLTVNVYYQNTTYTDSYTFQVANLTSATDPMPAVATPSPVTSDGITTTDHGQDGTGNSYQVGYVHLTVTDPSFVNFDPSNFVQGFNTQNGLVFTLSDQSGLEWDSLSPELSHNHLDTTYNQSTNTFDIYFPPLRTEAPVSGTPATLTFQATIPGDPNIYVEQFTPSPPGGYNLSAMYSTQSGSATASTEADLDSFLGNGNPKGIIYLSTSVPNHTIIVNQPLQITHSVTIIGQGDTILFDQDHAGGDTSAWPATATGAIYVNFPPGTVKHTQVVLQNFTIKFDEAPAWNNPSGTQPALWDPENTAGINHAVIDTGDLNTPQSTQWLTLQNMRVYGPPAYDASSFQHLQIQASTGGMVYVGEPAMTLVQTDPGGGGFGDYGTISNSTFQGGPINLLGGPWTITGNTVLGAAADTYSTAAFGLGGAHDSMIEGNQVTQSAINGTEFRLINFAGSGYNNTVQSNSFGGGAGATGNDVSYDSGLKQFFGLNDPEVMLEESNAVLFEGRLGAISTDGRVIVLPGVRQSLVQAVTGPGDVVSILSGVNSDGSPNMTYAGQYFRVAQQVPIAFGTGNNLELLLDDALPQPPSGGYFVVEVTPGFVNDSFINNKINLANKTSTALKLDGDTFGTRITGNQVSYGSVYNGVFPQVAMLIGAGTNSGATSGTSYNLPLNWTTLPDLGTVIQGNTFRNSLGLVLGVEHFISYYSAQNETALSTGRVYLTASVLQNTFTWNSSLLTGSKSWAPAFTSDLSGNDPVESSSPPTITIGENLSVDPAGAYGNPRYIWSVGGSLPDWGKDAQGNWNVPLFVDPVENAVNVQGNTATIINSNGSTTPRTEPTGQVYEGTVNGITVSATIAPITYNGNTYFPFNVNDYPSLYGANSLNISGVLAGYRSPIHASPISGGSSPPGTKASAKAGGTTVNPLTTYNDNAIKDLAIGAVSQSLQNAGLSPLMRTTMPLKQLTNPAGATWGIAVLSDPDAGSAVSSGASADAIPAAALSRLIPWSAHRKTSITAELGENDASPG
ncbi:MAG: hypothetical protein ACLP7Q_00415 [Isosphaeraceae bacterium]